MTLSVETLLVVSLIMAVFAAVTTVGTSLLLGAGFERLRAGFETIKKQTAFFSDAIRKLDGRVDGLEKQGKYFFEAINNLEQEAIPRDLPAQEETVEPGIEEECLISAKRNDALHAKTDDLLTASGFTANRLHFH